MQPPALAEPAADAVAPQQKRQRTADRQAFVAHRRKDEDPVEIELLRQQPVEAHIGEHAAGKPEVARRTPLQQAPHRGEHGIFQHLLNRGRDILAPALFGDSLHKIVHREVIAEIGPYAAVTIDVESRGDAVGEGRLSERGQAGELALVPVRPEAKRAGRRRIGNAEAVDLIGNEQAFVAAIERFKLAVAEMAMAVVDRVAAAVRRHQQRVVPIGVEQRWQRVRLVMIVEIDGGVVAKAGVAAKSRHVEKRLHPRIVGAQRLARHEARLFSFDMRPNLFAQPAPAAKMREVMHRKIPAAHRDDVDVAPRDAGDVEHLVDRQVGVAAVALDAGQAPELDGGLELIVGQHRGCGVVGAVIDGENELGHRGASDEECRHWSRH